MFRKNLAWFTLLVNLLTAGAAFAWVAVRPAETKALAGSQRISEKLVEVLEKAASPKSQKDPGQHDGDVDVEDLKAVAVADGVPGPPPRNGASGPPPRRGEDADATAEDAKAAPVETTPLGVWTRPLPEEIPAPELYPFRVDRRKYPDASSIRVELSVQNASGVFWKDATIILKSPGYPRAVAFHVGTWRIDQVAHVHYAFPKDELDKRISKLRVVAVEGERMDSLLSRHISRKRTEIAQELGSKEDVLESVGTADLTAEVEAFRVELPASLKPISGEADAAGFPDTEEGKQALALYSSACQAASEVDRSVRAFVEIVNEKGAASVDSEECRNLRRQALDGKVRFDQAGMDLSLVISRTKDEALRGQREKINELADRLFALIEAVDSQMPAASGEAQ